jgi:hypothetical protein
VELAFACAAFRCLSPGCAVHSSKESLQVLLETQKPVVGRLLSSFFRTLRKLAVYVQPTMITWQSNLMLHVVITVCGEDRERAMKFGGSAAQLNVRHGVLGQLPRKIRTNPYSDFWKFFIP